ncbi:succinyl-diaminopimelate desuccinylase [Pyruvatibacter mobilis]|uniref:Succinyl-diaminopimelate desuccinylase n=1 Tax=Pyruvatibacter mobilis TaxID=1712261 RepID=A0A845Q926_9HYPH|nr:succinyl-diaminopimelate desuccinylase [Pyruvatibacter mobilis]NBG94964.1 succinyl-diaminopimelate desuccinylase [Pyruvatibacter mobilis]QJD76908.1 succinyl-diaminopimelate desuccinylase [Pyruvatibacter mobilis]
MPIDPVAFAAELIRCPSVTPAEGGALDLLEERLTALGFTCHRLPFEEPGEDRVDNLYARIGTAAPNLCFAGHTDVVPPGNASEWQVGPFEGTVKDGVIWGRGAADMKGSIAAFAAAAAAYIKAQGTEAGSISFLITGDEEGPAVNGTVKMLDWLDRHNEQIDHCVVGEPTNPHELGEMIKIGRRGSVNMVITAQGKQGHVAYPHLADNPVPHLVAALAALDALELDQGTEHFQPSNLEITTVDVANEATNVIPATARARINIRFNDRHTGQSLIDLVKNTVSAVAAKRDATLTVSAKISGESFVTQPGPFVDLVARSVEYVLGRAPELSTTGGTSDARFIKNHCPVLEFGLVGETMHKVDERVPAQDVEQLTAIYHRLIDGYFAEAAAFAAEKQSRG